MPAFLVWGKGSRFPNGQRFTDLRSALQSPFMAAFDPKRTLAPCLQRSSGSHARSTDWLWMSLMRAGKANEARAMLARRPDSLPVSNAYTRRLKLYRGEIGPNEVFTPADTADVQVATLSYGLGNWYVVRGDTARAGRMPGTLPHRDRCRRHGWWMNTGSGASVMRVASLAW